MRLLVIAQSESEASGILDPLHGDGRRVECDLALDLKSLTGLLHQDWDFVIFDDRVDWLSLEAAVRVSRASDSQPCIVVISSESNSELAFERIEQGARDVVDRKDSWRLRAIVSRELRDAHRAVRQRDREAARISETFDQSAVGITQADLSGRYFSVNRRFAEIVGRSQEQLCGLTFRDITSEEDLEADFGIMRRLLSGEVSEFSREKRYMRPNGNLVWVEVTVTGVTDDAGELTHFATVVQDITEKKDFEQRLIRSEQFARSVLDSLPFEVAVLDRHGVIARVNEAWNRFATRNGITDMRLVGVGASYLDVCPPDLREKLVEVIEGKGSVSLEYPCHSDVKERWFLMKAEPLDADPGGAVVSHLDVTERRIAQNELEQSAREYRAIVETMGEGLVTLDRDGRILFANQKMGMLLGLDVSELVGRPITDFAADPEAAREIKKRITNPETTFEYENRLRRIDGRELCVYVTSVPRYDLGGLLTGRLSVMRDITDQVAAEEEQHRLHAQLEEMNRIESLGKLAGTMAHEFNNVLMAIQPFVDVINRTAPPDNTDIRTATRFIGDAVNRGRNVSQAVLRYARPASPSRALVRVPELLQDAGEIGRGIVGTKHAVRVDSRTDESIAVDREQLIQVFTNLIINARDAMTHGRGTISISATRDPDGTTYSFAVINHPNQFIHFAVADQGSGIPKEMVNRVFEPMVTTKRTGTGLGLAVTHQIITAHGGRVFAESHEGEGTTIHIFLPITGPASGENRAD